MCVTVCDMNRIIASLLVQNFSLSDIATQLEVPLPSIKRIAKSPLMHLLVSQLRDAGEVGVDEFMRESLTLNVRDTLSYDESGRAQSSREAYQRYLEDLDD